MGLAFNKSLQEYEKNVDALVDAYKQLATVTNTRQIEASKQKNHEYKNSTNLAGIPKIKKVKKIPLSVAGIHKMLKLADNVVRSKHDHYFKLKFENHLRFVNVLMNITQHLLQTEAIEKHIRETKEKEAFLRFHALDREKAEEKLSIYAHLHQLALQDQEAIIIALLLDRIKISELIISELEDAKKSLLDELKQNEEKYETEIKYIIDQSPIFTHVPDDRKKDIQKRLKEACDKFDQQYPPKDKKIKSKKKKKKEKGKKESSAKQGKKKDKKRDPRLDQKVSMLRHELKSLVGDDDKHSPEELNSLAKKIVKKHEGYRKEKHKISVEIKEIDQKIQQEESKKNDCLKKLGMISNPEKRKQIEGQIRKTYHHIEQKYHDKKRALKAKEQEIVREDSTLMQDHNEIFKKEISQEETTLEASEEKRSHAQHMQRSLTAKGNRPFKTLVDYERGKSRLKKIEEEKSMLRSSSAETSQEVSQTAPPLQDKELSQMAPAPESMKPSASENKTSFTPGKEKYKTQTTKKTLDEKPSHMFPMLPTETKPKKSNN